MDSEIKRLVEVWLLAIATLSYCYYVASKFPKGITRLISILPAVFLLMLLPLQLLSFSFGAYTALFLVFLANFNLLLFSFEIAYFSPLPPKLSHFISLACLPIKLKNSSSTTREPPTISVLLNVGLLILVHLSYPTFKHYLHPFFVHHHFGFLIFFQLQSICDLCCSLARAFAGFELEPNFKQPFRSTSLQDFWGRRWNRVFSGILRLSVYDPACTVFRRLLGEWARVPARLVTFLVSGLMHEIWYYYITRVPPTWEVTCFFVVHGFCSTMEVEVKKKLVRMRWRLNRFVSIMLTLAILSATSVWLSLPQLIRNGMDEKLFVEFSIVGSMMRRAIQRCLKL